MTLLDSASFLAQFGCCSLIVMVSFIKYSEKGKCKHQHEKIEWSGYELKF